jgi:hypothetical protein
MAKLNEITGQYSGLVGTVVLSNWKGIKYMRHKGVKSKKPRTVDQLSHQRKIALVSKFVYSMRKLLDLSFGSFAINKTGTNAAFSYNFKNAITGSYPDFKINYPLALVSRGDLPAVKNLSMQTEGRKITIQWENNTGIGSAQSGDPCFAAMYIADSPAGGNETYYSEVVTRETNRLSYEFEVVRQGSAHIWLVSHNAAGKDYADSMYAGELFLG